MTFRITGLNPAPFTHLYGLADEELARHGVLRVRVTQSGLYPDRIEMREAKAGEAVLLLNHECQPAPTPYRARHAVYIREGADTPYDRVGEVPEVMRSRLLSLRGYDASGIMIDADVVDGGEVEALIARLLDNPAIAYVHAHNARRGCYSGRIERA